MVIVLIFLCGMFFVIKSIRAEPFYALNPIMAMQTAYLGNFVLCFAAFRNELEFGAYIVLITVVLYATQIIIGLRTKIDFMRQKKIVE